MQASAALLMLAELRSDFYAQFSSAEREQGLVADDTTAFRRFSATIRRSMEGAYLGGQQKVDLVKSQVAETKSVMADNIDKVLQRGEDLDSVVEKTDRMVDSANIFKKKGVQIRKRLWWQNMRIKLLIAAAVLLVLIILFFVICRGVASSSRAPKPVDGATMAMIAFANGGSSRGLGPGELCWSCVRLVTQDGTAVRGAMRKLGQCVATMPSAAGERMWSGRRGGREGGAPTRSDNLSGACACSAHRKG